LARASALLLVPLNDAEPELEPPGGIAVGVNIELGVNEGELGDNRLVDTNVDVDPLDDEEDDDDDELLLLEAVALLEVLDDEDEDEDDEALVLVKAGLLLVTSDDAEVEPSGDTGGESRPIANGCESGG